MGIIEKMRLAKKMKAYESLVPPFDKPPIDFTAKEARAYFDWYLEHLDDRCAYVIQKAAHALKCDLSVFDYSFNSLIPLWKWFIQDAELAVRSNPMYKAFAGHKAYCLGQNGEMTRMFVDRKQVVLSTYSEFVLRDIGMYVGKTFMAAYPDVLMWSHKTTPKRYIHVNEPVLVGFLHAKNRDGQPLPKPFYPDFEPIHMVGVQAMNIIDHTARDTDVYRMCLMHAEGADTARAYANAHDDLGDEKHR